MAAGVVPTPLSRDPDLPRRDDEARARLQAVAARAQPLVAAGDRRLPVAGLLGELLPAGGVQRGSTVAVDGPPGSGSTTVALTLAAAATSAGEWAAVVDPRSGAARSARAPRPRPAWSSSGWRSCGACRPTGGARWSRRLLDGITVVVAAVPPHVRLGDARRLVARARERGAVLVAFGAWPVEAAVRVHTGPERVARARRGRGPAGQRVTCNVARRGEGPRVRAWAG